MNLIAQIQTRFTSIADFFHERHEREIAQFEEWVFQGAPKPVNHATEGMSRTAMGEPNAVERHNAYGWIKPDANACHICGRKAYTTPVEGFTVRECDRCEQLVCEVCAEIDADDSSVSWKCGGGCEDGPK